MKALDVGQVAGLVSGHAHSAFVGGVSAFPVFGEGGIQIVVADGRPTPFLEIKTVAGANLEFGVLLNSKVRSVPSSSISWILR